MPFAHLVATFPDEIDESEGSELDFSDPGLRWKLVVLGDAARPACDSLELPVVLDGDNARILEISGECRELSARLELWSAGVLIGVGIERLGSDGQSLPSGVPRSIRFALIDPNTLRVRLAAEFAMTLLPSLVCSAALTKFQRSIRATDFPAHPVANSPSTGYHWRHDLALAADHLVTWPAVENQLHQVHATDVLCNLTFVAALSLDDGALVSPLFRLGTARCMGDCVWYGDWEDFANFDLPLPVVDSASLMADPGAHLIVYVLSDNRGDLSLNDRSDSVDASSDRPQVVAFGWSPLFEHDTADVPDGVGPVLAPVSCAFHQANDGASVRTGSSNELPGDLLHACGAVSDSENAAMTRGLQSSRGQTVLSPVLRQDGLRVIRLFDGAPPFLPADNSGNVLFHGAPGCQPFAEPEMICSPDSDADGPTGTFPLPPTHLRMLQRSLRLETEYAAGRPTEITVSGAAGPVTLPAGLGIVVSNRSSHIPQVSAMQPVFRGLGIMSVTAPANTAEVIELALKLIHKLPLQSLTPTDTTSIRTLGLLTRAWFARLVSIYRYFYSTATPTGTSMESMVLPTSAATIQAVDARLKSARKRQQLRSMLALAGTTWSQLLTDRSRDQVPPIREVVLEELFVTVPSHFFHRLLLHCKEAYTQISDDGSNGSKVWFKLAWLHVACQLIGAIGDWIDTQRLRSNGRMCRLWGIEWLVSATTDEPTEEMAQCFVFLENWFHQLCFHLRDGWDVLTGPLRRDDPTAPIHRWRCVMQLAKLCRHLRPQCVHHFDTVVQGMMLQQIEPATNPASLEWRLKDSAGAPANPTTSGEFLLSKLRNSSATPGRALFPAQPEESAQSAGSRSQAWLRQRLNMLHSSPTKRPLQASQHLASSQTMVQHKRGQSPKCDDSIGEASLPQDTDVLPHHAASDLSQLALMVAGLWSCDQSQDAHGVLRRFFSIHDPTELLGLFEANDAILFCEAGHVLAVVVLQALRERISEVAGPMPPATRLMLALRMFNLSSRVIVCSRLAVAPDLTAALRISLLQWSLDTVQWAATSRLGLQPLAVRVLATLLKQYVPNPAKLVVESVNVHCGDVLPADFLKLVSVAAMRAKSTLLHRQATPVTESWLSMLLSRWCAIASSLQAGGAPDPVPGIPASLHVYMVQEVLAPFGDSTGLEDAEVELSLFAVLQALVDHSGISRPVTNRTGEGALRPSSIEQLNGAQIHEQLCCNARRLEQLGLHGSVPGSVWDGLAHSVLERLFQSLVKVPEQHPAALRWLVAALLRDQPNAPGRNRAFFFDSLFVVLAQGAQVGSTALAAEVVLAVIQHAFRGFWVNETHPRRRIPTHGLDIWHTRDFGLQALNFIADWLAIWNTAASAEGEGTLHVNPTNVAVCRSHPGFAHVAVTLCVLHRTLVTLYASAGGDGYSSEPLKVHCNEPPTNDPALGQQSTPVQPMSRTTAGVTVLPHSSPPPKSSTGDRDADAAADLALTLGPNALTTVRGDSVPGALRTLRLIVVDPMTARHSALPVSESLELERKCLDMLLLALCGGPLLRMLLSDVEIEERTYLELAAASSANRPVADAEWNESTRESLRFKGRQISLMFGRSNRTTGVSYASSPSRSAQAREPSLPPASVTAGGDSVIGPNLQLPQPDTNSESVDVGFGDLLAVAQVLCSRLQVTVSQAAATGRVAPLHLPRWATNLLGAVEEQSSAVCQSASNSAQAESWMHMRYQVMLTLVACDLVQAWSLAHNALSLVANLLGFSPKKSSPASSKFRLDAEQAAAAKRMIDELHASIGQAGLVEGDMKPGPPSLTPQFCSVFFQGLGFDPSIRDRWMVVRLPETQTITDLSLQLQRNHPAARVISPSTPAHFFDASRAYDEPQNRSIPNGCSSTRWGGTRNLSPFVFLGTCQPSGVSMDHQVTAYLPADDGPAETCLRCDQRDQACLAPTESFSVLTNEIDQPLQVIYLYPAYLSGETSRADKDTAPATRGQTFETYVHRSTCAQPGGSADQSTSWYPHSQYGPAICTKFSLKDPVDRLIEEDHRSSVMSIQLCIDSADAPRAIEAKKRRPSELQAAGRIYSGSNVAFLPWITRQAPVSECRMAPRGLIASCESWAQRSIDLLANRLHWAYSVSVLDESTDAAVERSDYRRRFDGSQPTLNSPAKEEPAARNVGVFGVGLGIRAPTGLSQASDTRSPMTPVNYLKSQYHRHEQSSSNLLAESANASVRRLQIPTQRQRRMTALDRLNLQLGDVYHNVNQEPRALSSMLSAVGLPPVLNLDKGAMTMQSGSPLHSDTQSVPGAVGTSLQLLQATKLKDSSNNLAVVDGMEVVNSQAAIGTVVSASVAAQVVYAALMAVLSPASSGAVGLRVALQAVSDYSQLKSKYVDRKRNELKQAWVRRVKAAEAAGRQPEDMPDFSAQVNTEVHPAIASLHRQIQQLQLLIQEAIDTHRRLSALTHRDDHFFGCDLSKDDLLTTISSVPPLPHRSMPRDPDAVAAQRVFAELTLDHALTGLLSGSSRLHGISSSLDQTYQMIPEN